MPNELIGKKVGSYRVIRLIGEGGMGQVYEAVHDQIERRAAIKVLHPEYARNQEIAARFFNEARAVNIVGHPGLVSVFEVGNLDDGAAYIVMEFLSGESLRRRIERCKQLGTSGLRIIRQVASSLDATHEKGIIHRDLKPDNIMIVADSEVAFGERAKVLDFGIARLGAQGQGPQPVRTRTGAVLGTPLYMAPEQCGMGAGITSQSDVYALGVIFYEVLAGQPPFVGESAAEVIGQHLFAVPPPIATKCSEVPQEVAALVHRMLAKNPTERPSMRQVVAELDRLVTRFPPDAKKDEAAPLLPEANTARLSWALKSTLGHATGQYRDRRLRRLTLLLSGGIGIVALMAAIVLRGGHKPPPNVSPPASAQVSQPAASSLTPPVNKVHWSLKSIPAGAQVVRISDGKVLGQTPWQSEQDAGAGELQAVLRLPGYKDVPLLLDFAKSTTRTETLLLDDNVNKPRPVTRPAGVPAKAAPPRSTPASSAKQPLPVRTLSNEAVKIYK